ncbi:unnamed protein product, partial [Closterium sp. NIES-54]
MSGLIPLFLEGSVWRSVRQVAASSRASASGRLVASCSCRVLTHETHRWHHRLGHPSLPRLRSMHSRLLERYFLLVVDDYTRYTTVFPSRRKADVSGVLIPWIRATRLQLHERFQQDFPVLRLHSDRGGEFFSGVLETFCQDEGIAQSFTLPASPQKNGIAERRIGLIMEVARTSMIHAAAPHFLWSFTVRYAAHQLNLWPVSLLQRPRPHSVGRDSLVMRRRFGSGARSPLFAIPKQVSSLLALSAVSSWASPPTLRPGSSTTLPRVVFCPLRTSPSTSRS